MTSQYNRIKAKAERIVRDMVIVGMRDSGMSYAAIAKQFGLSRQRIEQIVRLTSNRMK